MKNVTKLVASLGLALVLMSPAPAQAGCFGFFSSFCNWGSCNPCYSGWGCYPSYWGNGCGWNACYPGYYYPSYACQPVVYGNYYYPAYYYPTYSYPVYSYSTYYYPTYSYPVYPAYYSVPTGTGSAIIVAKGGENPKVNPGRQPMVGAREQLARKGTAAQMAERSDRVVTAKVDPRAIHRSLLVKYRTGADVPQLLERAQAAYKAGDYKEGYDLSWAAVELDGNNARAWYSRAANELANGMGQEARASADMAANLEKKGQTGSLDSLSFKAEHRKFLKESLVKKQGEANPSIVLR